MRFDSFRNYTQIILRLENFKCRLRVAVVQCRKLLCLHWYVRISFGASKKVIGLGYLLQGLGFTEGW